jgi:hypothetical protein
MKTPLSGHFQPHHFRHHNSTHLVQDRERRPEKAATGTGRFAQKDAALTVARNRLPRRCAVVGWTYRSATPRLTRVAEGQPHWTCPVRKRRGAVGSWGPFRSRARTSACCSTCVRMAPASRESFRTAHTGTGAAARLRLPALIWMFVSWRSRCGRPDMADERSLRVVQVEHFRLRRRPGTEDFTAARRTKPGGLRRPGQ